MSFTSLFAAPPKPGQDRRSARRRRPDHLVYADFGKENGGIVIDISEGGLQFQSVERVLQGDRLPVTFVLTGSVATVKATAEVVWSNDSGKGGGLKLLDLPKTARREISAWVSSTPSPATSPQGPSAPSNGRASFNLLTTEGRVTPADPVSDDAAMAMARLLVARRGSSRPDPTPETELPIREEAAPEIIVAPAAVSEPEAELETSAPIGTAGETVAEAVAEPLAEVPAETVAETISETIVPPAELAEQIAGLAEHAVEAPGEASPEAIAATEAPVDLLTAEAAAEIAQESAALPEAIAAEPKAAEVTSEASNEVASEVTNEVFAEAAAVAETPAETCFEPPIETVVEAQVENPVEILDASLVAGPAETAALTADAANLDMHDAYADAPPTSASIAQADAILADEIADRIAPAITDEVMEGVVAELEAKPALAAEIAQPLEADKSAESSAADMPEVFAPPVAEEFAQAEAIESASVAEFAPVAETAPQPPMEAAPTAAVVPAENAASEAPIEALLEILLSAAAETAQVAPPATPATISVAASAAPGETPVAASAEPISVAQKTAQEAKDTRTPSAHLPAHFVKSGKRKKHRKHNKHQKNAPSIHDSMRGYSILADRLPVSVPVAAESETAQLPGWRAQVLKFAVGVGVGCCLVAGAFVGMVLLSPGHRAFSFAHAQVNAVAEASAPTVAPTLDVEVIDLNSRRWHLSGTTQDASPFAPQDPVVELTPSDSQTAVAAPAPVVPALKSPAAKLSAPKSRAAESPASNLSSRAPKAPAVSSKATIAATTPSPVAPQPAAKSDSLKILALPSPMVARSTGGPSDVGAPAINETISSSISSPIVSSPMGSSAIGSAADSSAPPDPRTPVSSNTVFPSALLLPPVRHNADFHIAAAIRQVNPAYPPEAKRQQVTGTVRIDAFVGKDGRAHSLKVISGDPRLSSATLAAVSDWTFRPAQLDGESVTSEVTISVVFDLH